MHFSGGKHDFSAHQVDGDVTTDGDCNDLTLSEIKGKIAQSGEILGDVHIENVTGSIHLHTSVTDLQVAELPGDITLNSDDLRVSEAKGTVHVITRSKDVDLNEIYGDSSVEDRDGTISVEPAGVYAVDAKNGKGDIELTLPPNASATVDGRSRNGDMSRSLGSPWSAKRTRRSAAKSAQAQRRLCSAPTTATCASRKAQPSLPRPPRRPWQPRPTLRPPPTRLI